MKNQKLSQLSQISQSIKTKSSCLRSCNFWFFFLIFLSSPYSNYPFGPENGVFNTLFICLSSIIGGLYVFFNLERYIFSLTSTKLIQYLKHRDRMIATPLIPQESSKMELVQKFDEHIPINPIVNIIHEYTTLPKNFVALNLFEHDWEFYFSNWLKFELSAGHRKNPHVFDVKLLWSTNNQEIRLCFPIEFGLDPSRFFQIKHEKNEQAIKNLKTLNSIFQNYFDNSLRHIHPQSFLVPIESERLNIDLSSITQQKYNLTIQIKGVVVQHFNQEEDDDASSNKNNLIFKDFKFDVLDMEKSPQTIA